MPVNLGCRAWRQVALEREAISSHAIPHALLAGCVERRVCDVVDHEDRRTRDWMIAAIERADFLIGQALYFANETIDYGLPWRAETSAGSFEMTICDDRCVPIMRIKVRTED